MNTGKSNRKNKPKQLNIMFGCPGDAEPFIENARKAIDQFNTENSEQFQTELKLVYWKQDTHSSAENTQESINKQFENCECLIAVFYKTAGHAITSSKPGTFEEIDYFKNHNKQVFLFRFTGKAEVDFSNHTETNDLIKYFETLENERKNLYFREYIDGDDLQAQINKDLNTHFTNKKNTRTTNRKPRKKHNSNWVQNAMHEYMRFVDKWLAINSKDFSFSFSKKAKSLIDGMQDDGSVQYYIGKQKDSVLRQQHLRWKPYI